MKLEGARSKVKHLHYNAKDQGGSIPLCPICILYGETIFETIWSFIETIWFIIDLLYTFSIETKI